MSKNVGQHIHTRSSCILIIPDKSRKSAFVSFKGSVYDITSFLPDHPGGDDIMLDYVGGDIGQIMADESQHVHSRSAYDMMEEYKVGELGGDEKIVSEGMSIFNNDLESWLMN